MSVWIHLRLQYINDHFHYGWYDDQAHHYDMDYHDQCIDLKESTLCSNLRYASYCNAYYTYNEYVLY